MYTIEESNKKSLHPNILFFALVLALFTFLVAIYIFKSDVNFSSILNIDSKLDSTSDFTHHTEESFIYVSINGAVINPGVYKLAEGSRIFDLLSKSGGLATNADPNFVLTQLNLVQILNDEDNISVPSLNNSLMYSTTAYLNDKNSDSINVNLSSYDQILSLPGIGPVYGTKIIDYRPYKDISDLLEKTKIPQSVLNSIEPIIVF